ncbi:MAG: L-threonylcarbamoyladenylate synthase [Nitrososphaerota archaeon]|nr:L-threonylcarbamoyladenylate synthase [Candidatus Calditenuaceae archaeon]MDW8072695.1 L-threonylcarbamoyladenylate synthase [Nitrososphaerota archaeon]
MNTKILQVDRVSPDPSAIGEAARVIRTGGLVAFPTETVYGLGADAMKPQAVSRIFAVKGRPPDNPLIIHISRLEELYRIGESLDWRAEELARRFWPGPLTLVVKRSPILPDVTVAGLDTAAVRMPRHEVALRLIEAAGTPIAAPSANKSGRPSPTSAEHVLADLGGEIELILDAGPTDIGVESTVLDISSERAVILRPGGVSREEIEAVIGKVEVHPSALGLLIHGELAPRSPGMKYRHYAPEAKLIVVEGELGKVRSAVQALAECLMKRGLRVGVLGSDGHPYKADVLRDLGPRSNPSEAAKRLFRCFREMDEEGVEVVVAEGWQDESGIGLALMNRLRKASGGAVLDANWLLEELRDSPGRVYTEVIGT